MRTVTAAFAMVGASIALGAAASTEAFLVAPSSAPAAPQFARTSFAATGGHAKGAAASSMPSAGLWCVCGLAAVVALSPKGRRSTAQPRGAVAVKVAAAANLVAERLREAAQASKKFQKAFGELNTRGAQMMLELEATEAKVVALEAERDGLKTQLNGLADQIDTALIGRLQSSAAMAARFTAMKAAATPQVNDREKVQNLEAERDALKTQLHALVEQIDDLILAPLQSTGAMSEQLPVLKGVVETPASAAAAATPTVASYPSPRSARGRAASPFTRRPRPRGAVPSPKALEECSVLVAQRKWAQGIVDIGELVGKPAEYTACAANVIDTLYGYGSGPVLFKPTKVAAVQFRLGREEALSYFVAGNAGFPEDKGFALHPWTAVRFENEGILLEGRTALAQGNYFFTDLDGQETKVEYTFGYFRDASGQVKINLHHSSLPYQPA